MEFTLILENQLKLVFISKSSSWVLRSNTNEYDYSEAKHYLFTLPLLAMNYQQFKGWMESNHIKEEFNWIKLIDVAINIKNEFWSNLALSWLEESNIKYSFTPSQIDQNWMSQKLRHRIKKMNARL